MNERIVITGLGAISPLGLSANESWQGAINGVSGVGPITLFAPENCLSLHWNHHFHCWLHLRNHHANARRL